MKKPPRAYAALAAAVLLLTACNGDSADDTTHTVSTPTEPATEPTVEAAAEPEPEPEPEPEADDPADASPQAESRGIVNVNGIAYDITELRNCVPLSDDIVEAELELQGFGEHDAERVQIDVYIQTLAGIPFDDVSWAGPEGIYGGPEDATVTLNSDGTRVEGAATLVDAMTQTDELSIDFDLEVPAETVTCR